MKECPCGAGFPYTDCCGPLIRGATFADTAEDLMRSRYTAYTKGEWEYLEQTRHHQDLQETIFTRSNLRSEEICWNKLEILKIEKGGAFDETGKVHFIAHYSENGEPKTLQENSAFLKEKGRWYYSQLKSKVIPASRKPSLSKSKIPSKPLVRNQPKIRRNEPCPCGSEKKYKKCCGR